MGFYYKIIGKMKNALGFNGRKKNHSDNKQLVSILCVSIWKVIRGSMTEQLLTTVAPYPREPNVHRIRQTSGSGRRIIIDDAIISS